MEDLPDSFELTDDLTAAAASLDVQDYLQRDADAIFESAFLSLRSDIPRNPRSPGYDMTTPPANHREAMMSSDMEEWKKVEDKELGMLRSMGVYVDEPLPEGRKCKADNGQPVEKVFPESSALDHRRQFHVG